MDFILVTGAAGFIGSRLAHFFSKTNPVIAVDAVTHFETRKRTFSYPEIRIERENLFNWLESSKPNIKAVFHMGACTRTEEQDWAYLEKWNLNYSKNIWNYCSKNNIPLVYASTAATYGDGTLSFSDQESEISRLKPLNKYGTSKHLFDLWALEEEKQKNHPPFWAGFKFFNVFGYGEDYKKNMASVAFNTFHQIKKEGFSKLFKSQNPNYLDGHQVRDFISVEDVLKVLEFSLKHPIKRGIYNLGTGKARTFLDLARAVFSSMQIKENIHFIEMPHSLTEIYQYYTCAEMLQLKKAGYSHAFLTLEEGIQIYVKQLQQNSV